jgi:hypothetical protein
LSSSAEREAGYRLVEGSAGRWSQASAAAAVAAFRRATSPYVVAPVDGSSLTVSSAGSDSDFGPVGNSKSKSVGVNVMGGILVEPNGTPLGSGGQVYWVRPPVGSERRAKADIRGRKTRLPRERPFANKETAHWLHVTEGTLAAAEVAGYAGQVWFQMDRGADCHEVLGWGQAHDCWVTVRAAHDRKVLFAEQRLLWDFMEAQPVCGTYELDVPAGPNRTARRAKMEVRVGQAALALRSRKNWKELPGAYHGVLATEVSPVPGEEKPIEWLLLTTRPGMTFEDAKLVIDSYALRWRIEEVHKTWKSVTKVEESNLRSAEPFQFWAVLLFSVAVRIERLKYIARTNPHAPAEAEFSPAELMAIDGLKREDRRFVMPKRPTVGQIIVLIAELGGYTGFKQSGGPPGSITIARGLQRVRPAAEALERLTPKCDQ